MDDFNDVLFEEYNNKGIIILNRPKCLNALTVSMGKRIADTLQKWEKEKEMVIIKAAGDKAFCSGGDLRVAYANLKNDKLTAFKQQERHLQIAFLIKNYKIPIVSIMNGMTMGAGAALAMYSKYRIVTEKASFGMPEVGIGYLLDVGTTYVFSRLHGKLGLYMALTGQRLTGSDMFYVDVATHFCISSNLNELEEDILKSSTDLEKIFKKFSVKTLPVFSYSSVMSKIDYCFSAISVEDILTRLDADPGDWAKKTSQILRKNSPTSLNIVFKAVNLAKNMDFASCLRMEHILNCQRLDDEDFNEGVRAVILEKDFKPKWNPPTLQEVCDKDIEKYFSLVPNIEKLINKL